MLQNVTLCYTQYEYNVIVKYYLKHLLNGRCFFIVRDYMNELNIIYKSLTELKPYEKNPRRNEAAVDYVAKSIEKFGFRQPIVIDKNGVIVAGHTRYKAAEKLNLNTVPCVVASDLTEQQIKAYRLADNKVAEMAGWDYDLLGEELDELAEFDMQEFGFTVSEDIDIDGFFEDAEEQAAKEPKKIQCPHCGEWFEV